MYQLAEIAGSDPRAGTDNKEASRQLDKIDHLFKTRFICYAVGDDSNGLTEPTNGDYIGDPIPQKDFEKEITRSIDKGHSPRLVSDGRESIKKLLPSKNNKAEDIHV
jgi:hypothetical protein